MLLAVISVITAETWKLVLDPRDSGAGLNPVFRQDPHEFSPQANPELGIVEQWGTTAPGFDDLKQRAPWPADQEGQEAQQRRPMQIQRLYKKLLGGGKSPEEQWIGVRMGLKNESILTARAQKDAAGTLDVEFKLRVALTRLPKVEQLGGLPELNPSIWRRLVVHGRTTLRTLHDHVLGPAFGWRRGYHCYTFTDLTDGATLGPSTCRANDMMHAAYRAGCAHGCLMEDDGVLLADLVSRPGDRLLYTYDLGDAWFHMITVEQIKRVGGECDELPLLGQARPSRAAKVIDGANARIPLASKAWVPTPTK